MQPDDYMYQIFEIKLKFQNRDLNEVLELGWSVNGNEFMKTDEEYDVMYLLDLNKKTLRCLITDIFVLDEEEWKKEDYSNREKIIENALNEVRSLNKNMEIETIERMIKHV